ncbi:MAG: 2-hydroxychromene-2-carboxylate isomerase [Hyphomonadaceae bacterium]
MSGTADWYLDYLSPYPYLQLSRFKDLPASLTIQPRPVLFAALLNHWGHKGPAEIPFKARQTYYYTHWLARKRGLSFVGPPRHPFNPLPLLRLTIALGATVDVVRAIYAHVWGEGNDAQSAESLAALGAKLGVADVDALIYSADVKDALKANTDEAIARGVFGVPTFYLHGAKSPIFWGDDVTDMFIDYLADPALFDASDAHMMSVTPAAMRRAPI